jgi:hypothetical protein
LLTDYVPRGCISTTDAVDSLFEERRPDLVSSAPERVAEIQQLHVLKRAAARPLPIEPLNLPAPVATERKRLEFTERDEERLGELAAIEAEVLSAREAAASEIRTALAEGDFPAMMLASHGHEAPIPPATWRAKGGLECVKAGRVRIRFPDSIDVVEGRAFVKEIDLITWLSKHAPKPFSEIRINFIVQSPQPTKRSFVVGNKRKAADVAAEMLPPWLTPMEAVAWIVSRDAKIVACASPDKNSVRTFVCDYVLPDGKRVSGTESLPPGMTLRWLDAFAAHDPDGALPTNAALSQLLNVLQSSQLVARAECTASGERRDIDADEWTGMVFDTLPGQERILLPHRTYPGQLTAVVEKRWRNVRLPRQSCLVLWPASGATDSATNQEDIQRQTAQKQNQDLWSANEGMISRDSINEGRPVSLRRASDPEINAVITSVYDYASSEKMKAPNVKEIAVPVIKRLAAKGLIATKIRVQTLAASKHKHRRRQPGPRVYDSLLPFCDPEM